MTGNDQTSGLPQDPAFEKVRRKMVRLLAISIAVLFVGLIAVLSAVVYRTSDEAGTRATGTLPPIALAGGARIVSAQIDGGSALLLSERAGGEQELLLLDLDTGKVVSRYAVDASGKGAASGVQP